MKKKLTIVIALSAFGVSCAVQADAPAGGREQARVSSAWKQLCDQATAFTANVRAVLLADKDLTKKPFKLYQGLRYQTLKDSSKGYAQPIANHLFFGVFNKEKAVTLKAVGGFVEKIDAHAAEFHRKNKSLLAKAERIERAAKIVHRSVLDGNAATLKSLKSVAFTGKGGDELSYSLRKLSAALAAGRKKEAAIWAGEVHGAAVRLVDLLRWVDLQSEWIVDLCAVFGSFKPYFDNSDAALAKVGGWRIFMFGRCPGGMSLQKICSQDVLMVEYLLIDFYTVSVKDAAAMGKAVTDAAILAVTPARRDAYRKIAAALPANAKEVLRKIIQSDYELSAFGSNIWRYEDEDKVDNLTRSLKRYVANYQAPSVGAMMDIIHIPRGAWGSTSTAIDRYHPKIVEWASETKGTPREALLRSYKLARELYSRGGYQGNVHTLTDAIKSGKMDCIRISQMIGAIYADAGYVGLHPIRVGKGNVSEKKVAIGGHTLLSAKFADGEVCVDGLYPPGFGAPYAQRYKSSSGVLSCSRGYRALCGWVAGEIYFPQGPIGPVQLRIPYCGIKRKGFSEQTGKPIR